MQRTQILTLIAVAAFSGAGGYFLARWNAPIGDAVHVSGKNPDGTDARPVRAAPEPGHILSPGLSKLRGNEPLTASNATALAFRALEEGDPVTRMAAITLLLESMTPENALAIRQAFLDITTQTGRQSPAEWALMVQRCGAVLGAKALKEFANDNHNLVLAIEGFASVDAAGALAALKEAGIEGPHITNAWLAGICRKDPQKALSLALGGDHDGANGRALLNLAIQSGGIEGAREALQSALDAPGGLAASSPAFPGIFEALAKALAHKYRTNGTPGEMLKWLEQQKDQPYLSDALINDAAYDNMIKGDPGETIAWIGRMHAGQDGPPAGIARLFESINKEPGILTKLNDASFKQLISIMGTDAVRLGVIAAILEPTNPARASQIRAAIPSPPAPPEPSAPPAPGGDQ